MHSGGVPQHVIPKRLVALLQSANRKMQSPGVGKPQANYVLLLCNKMQFFHSLGSSDTLKGCSPMCNNDSIAL